MKSLDLHSDSSNHYQSNNETKEENSPLFRPLFTPDNSNSQELDDDLLLMNNLDSIDESVANLANHSNIEETTSDFDDENQEDEVNRKYLEVLKKYWGYSSFRK